MVEIELIPWLHGVKNLVHEDVINYLTNVVPKNAVLAAEITPHGVQLAENIMDNPSYLNRMSGRMGYTYDDNILTAVELCAICKKRNITIVPINTPVSDNIPSQVLKNKGTRDFPRLAYQGEVKRNDNFTDQIVAATHKIKGKKIYVLIGLGHVPSIQLRLTARGINSTIQTDLFGERKEKINEMLRMNVEELEALKNKGPDEAIKIHEAIHREVDSIPNREFKINGRTTVARWFLLDNLEKMKHTREKRWGKMRAKAKKRRPNQPPFHPRRK